MCENCNWEECVDDIDAALDAVEGIPERGAEFAASVGAKLQDIKEWIEEKHHVTDAQETAVANMANGIQRWLEH